MSDRYRGSGGDDDGGSDEREQRDRVMGELEDARDQRERRAYRSAGLGDEGPGGLGRRDPDRPPQGRDDGDYYARGIHRRYGGAPDPGRDPGGAYGGPYRGGSGGRGGGEAPRTAPGGGGEHRGRGPRGYRRSDARILEEVNDRLTDDPHVDAGEIQADVKDGEVTLTGTVDGRDARRRAEDVAEAVSGVTYVLNNLRVRQPGGSGVVG